jgi:hypothetical protein
MNERIRELAEQARLYAEEQYPGSFVKYDPKWFEFYNEKFAKLIAAECAAINDRIENGNQHLGTDDYLEAIQRTFFGVDG